MDWRPVSEFKTEHNKSVILAAYNADKPDDDPTKWVVGEAWWCDEEPDLGWWWAGEGSGDYHAERIDLSGLIITHFMDLPPHPNGTK